MNDLQLRFILFLQSFSPALDPLFRFISSLASYDAALITIVIFTLCTNWRTGLKLLCLYCVSIYLNRGCKELFETPRPFQLNPSVRAIDFVRGYGFPSGHVQTITVIWCYMAFKIRTRWFFYLASTIIFAVGISRLYLGAHSMVDIIGGCAIGAFLVFATAHLTEMRHELKLRRKRGS